LPKAARQRVSRVFTGLAKERLTFPADQRKRLVDHYREDVERLQVLIDRDLSAWLVP
jgi:hypothetical protein